MTHTTQSSGPVGRTASLFATATLVVGLLLSASTGWAQQKGPTLKERLVGTWTFASSTETRKDGTKVDRWGAHPKGSLMFDANGRYMFIITRSDLPKFAVNSATEGTADEDKAVVKGVLFYFGTYTVNEADKTLVTHVEGSSFPNIVGTDQKRSITSLTSDELRYHNALSSIAGDAQVVWKRAK